jgi:hypothetical protein
MRKTERILVGEIQKQIAHDLKGDVVSDRTIFKKKYWGKV